jgi:hypothetical protein
MMKYINVISKSRISVINVVYKHDSATEVIRVYRFGLQHIYTYSAEKLLTPSDEIHVL